MLVFTLNHQFLSCFAISTAIFTDTNHEFPMKNELLADPTYLIVKFINCLVHAAETPSTLAHSFACMTSLASHISKAVKIHVTASAMYLSSVPSGLGFRATNEIFGSPPVLLMRVNENVSFIVE